MSPLDLPDPAQRLAAQYRDVGVGHSWIDASGGRSMVEEMPGQVNGYDTARTMASRGFRGCWVIALGTNDTANVSAGSSAGRMARIQELMAVAHGAPVMWVNVKTLDPSGPWAEANMQLWNDTLLQACRQYPNLRIFDWASVAQDGWFISDGIHYTAAGYAARAHLIARALARAFPVPGTPRLRHPLTAWRDGRRTGSLEVRPPAPRGPDLFRAAAPLPGRAAVRAVRAGRLPPSWKRPFRPYLSQWPDITHRPLRVMVTSLVTTTCN